MDFAQWFKKYRKILLPIIGLIAFLAYIMIFNVDILQIGAIISRLNLFYFGLAIIVGFGEILFFALSWNMLLSFLKIGTSIKNSYLYVLYGEYMDIIVPAGNITGDLARIYLISKEKHGSETKAAASVLMQRMLGMGLNVLTLLLGMVLIIIQTQLNTTVVYYVMSAGILISLGLGVLILLIAKEDVSVKIVNTSLSMVDRVSRKRWNASRWRDQIDIAIEKFRSSMTAYKDNPRVLGLSFGYLALNWLCSFSIPFIIFLSLGYPISWSVIIVTASIEVAVMSIPVGIPFQVGIPEIAMTTLFIALGVPADLAATATILTRLITLWFRFGLGFAAQQWLELKPKKSV